MKKNLLYLLLLILSLPAIAQEEASLPEETAAVYFFILPKKGTYLKIDKELLIQLDTTYTPLILQLPIGKHTVEVWRPDIELYSDTVSVKSGERNRVSVAMNTPSKEYTLYKQQIKEQRPKVAQITGITIVNIVANIASVYWLTEKHEYSATKDRLSQIRLDYSKEVRPSELERIKAEFEEHSGMIDDFRKELVISSLIHAGAYTGSFFICRRLWKKRSAEIIRPANDNPLLNSKTSSILYITPNQIGFTLNF
jgi:hypothetical protein